MRKHRMITTTLSTLAISMLFIFNVSAQKTITVISTFSDYASIAKEIGGDKIVAEYLSHGAQDPHFVAPKPSLAMKLKKADMFICSGMDLEMWATTLLDKARNKNIMDGSISFSS